MSWPMLRAAAEAVATLAPLAPGGGRDGVGALR